jgi:hypothetical protein
MILCRRPNPKLRNKVKECRTYAKAIIGTQLLRPQDTFPVEVCPFTTVQIH